MMYCNFSINIFVMKKSNKRSNSDLIWFLVGTTKWTVFLFTGVIMSFISGVLKKKKKMGKWENSIFRGEFFLYIFVDNKDLFVFQLDCELFIFRYLHAELKCWNSWKIIHRTNASKATQLYSSWFSCKPNAVFFFYKGNLFICSINVYESQFYPL